MGTFTETAMIDYCLSFVEQENKLPFSVSVCSKQTEFDVCFQQINRSCHGDMETWRHGDIEMETWTWKSDIFRKKIKVKREVQAIFINPFPSVHSANGSLSICTKKQTEVIRLQMD